MSSKMRKTINDLYQEQILQNNQRLVRVFLLEKNFGVVLSQKIKKYFFGN
jgi:hypothetical protein